MNDLIRKSRNLEKAEALDLKYGGGGGSITNQMRSIRGMYMYINRYFHSIYLHFGDTTMFENIGITAVQLFRECKQIELTRICEDSNDNYSRMCYLKNWYNNLRICIAKYRDLYAHKYRMPLNQYLGRDVSGLIMGYIQG